MTTSKIWTPVVLSGLLIVASLVAPAGQLADALMITSAVIAGYRVALSAWSSLRIRIISIDLLVIVAAVGALFIHNYWESAAVTFLFALGKALEQATMNRTRRALNELVDAAPETATVLKDGQAEIVDLWEVEPGDVVLVKNGEPIPVDGRMISGSGGVDEATITGESLLASKTEGQEVFAGTWLRSGALYVEAVAVGSESLLATIIHRVEDAQDDKARTQTFLEKFSRWYTPAVIVGALLAGILSQDLELALTLLVIGCPGALVISIPVSIVAGIGRAAKDGVLIKGGEFLEAAAKVDTVIVDKTGTLTTGRPELTDVEVLDPLYSADEVLTLAAEAETASEHPLADAIIRGAQARDLQFAVASDAHNVTGTGIVTKIDDRTVAVGTADLLDEEPTIDHLASFNQAGKTAMYVVVNGAPVGVIAVADTVLDDAASAINALHDAGIQVIMATGDAPLVAKAVAAKLNLHTVHARLLPEDKLELVAKYRAEGHTVAMLGDGVNDTPALATADIGVAMGAAGTPAAIETADLALLADRLPRLPYALNVARRTVRTMRVNIAIALLTVLVLLAGVLLGGVTMAIGMLVHEASVLLVIGIAMLLLRPTL
ncbi:Heavy metal-translocating P-type ATPase, Cd/Co/Hg/Pb/Zn-transporting [Corynebacterium camporealensis]|uniref:Heavy metal-translocating P-type ATPase, Cd/Co/Hg/Pb/Zn-transporting n=1 Tax=Corynebacterium camporealensis TaxID=161896 RepID=A0A0F6QUX3_9CORY|nr:cation-translocating P-type ATPase [Corynebacterium camporealensis]AKE38020.1 heavy metal-translocating P-type ATPase, Cd/Co/Hg/Pb/Zn-transporting [Corynebacterium camporealensis]AVH87351.1 Heavy metal-translocating P-type ATPase, Cd/Co/Hg/Pb/Zn-transporting [Corynebacterium camporealensis]